MIAIAALLLGLLAPPVADVRLHPTPHGTVILWTQQSDAVSVVVVKERGGVFAGIATIEGSAPGAHGAIDVAPEEGARYFIGECWRLPELRCLPSYGPYQLYRLSFPLVTR